MHERSWQEKHRLKAIIKMAYISDYPHRRLNLLTGEWVLVSPQRTRRPWLGQVEKPPEENLPAYDSQCYLCPGNTRAGGRQNPAYTSTFVFDNDFAALLPEIPEPTVPDPADSPLFKAVPETGLTRVVCFSPRHDLSLPELSQEEVETVVKTWCDQTSELGKMEQVSYVQIFENKGAMMGCSNPHPHSQIWASRHVPNEPHKELLAQKVFREEHRACLLCSYLEAERSRNERLVDANNSFSVLVPFWAVWPFETLLVPNRHVASLTDLDESEITDLADILRQITARYDNLFEISFPYSMGFHQAPRLSQEVEYHHLHTHFYPPLLRSASIRKFMVGYEMLAMPQRDLTPESAAERLRALSGIHYRNHHG
jgi:UDPglucose--hexose-1-phosphate uridylyltransferase